MSNVNLEQKKHAAPDQLQTSMDLPNENKALILGSQSELEEK